ncbi:MAG TPA: hypothetical protein VIA18_05595 [Polyangia bacterium]|nr:hypothetical protein [Polyangia bacterium]
MRWIGPALVLACAACSAGNNSPKSGAGAAGLALVGDDGATTALALVDPAASTAASCLGGLSSDVVLPSTPALDHEIVLIDRLNARLSWVTPADCAVARTLAVDTGFAADPHDVVSLSATKAYVTRAATNPTPGASADDAGADLLIIDPSAGTITGRVDLSGQATAGDLQAQPDRALLANGKVWVSLGNRSADGKTLGHGRVVAVDPKTDAVALTVDLPALRGCSGLDYLPATKDLVVGCAGDPNDTPDNRIAESAIALINIGAAAPSVMTSIGASGAGNRPFSPALFAAIGDDFILAVSPGVAGMPDSLYRLELDSGTATLVVNAGSSAVDSAGFGGVVWDSVRRRAYLADDAAMALRVFDVSNPRDTPQIASFSSPARPRQLAFY